MAGLKRYIINAIGEIVLIVIGILIAVQLNNKNAKALQESEILRSLSRVNEELIEGITSEKSYIKESDELIRKMKLLLTLMAQKKQDSLPYYKECIGAVATAWTYERSFAVFEELIQSSHFHKIENLQIRRYLRVFEQKLERLDRMNDQINIQYLQTIEPYFIKNINYVEVSLPKYQKYLIRGGPETNYMDLIDNMEFWNIVTLKLEWTQGLRTRQHELLEYMMNLTHDLNAEIKNKS